MDGWGTLLVAAWLALAGVGMISGEEKPSTELNSGQTVSNENILAK